MPSTFINGINLHYNIYGSGPPIILVHALGMDQSMWDLQIPEFSKSCQVIVYDLRGHGQSDSPDHPYSIDLFTDDLDQFLHFLGLKKAVFLGLSLGGRILIRLALKYPQEASALILADAQSEIPAASVEKFHQSSEIARKGGIGTAAEDFFSWPLVKNLASRNPDRFKRERERFLGTSAIGFANSCLAISRMEPLTGKLGLIKVPTMALAGEEDEPYLPYLDIYERQIGGCQRQTIPSAGHLSNLENPRAFNEIVMSFLKGLRKI